MCPTVSDRYILIFHNNKFSMDKMHKCIDCGKILRNMSPLAKRCIKCRRKFQDISSYNKKKKDRAMLSKKKTLEQVKERGIDSEIAEEASKRVVREIGTKEDIAKKAEENLIKNLEEPQDSFLNWLTPATSLWGVSNHSTEAKKINEIFNKKIEDVFNKKFESKFKEELEKNKKLIHQFLFDQF